MSLVTRFHLVVSGVLCVVRPCPRHHSGTFISPWPAGRKGLAQSLGLARGLARTPPLWDAASTHTQTIGCRARALLMLEGTEAPT